MSNQTEDLVIRLRTKMKHSAAYSAGENERRLVALGEEAANEIVRLRRDISRLNEALRRKASDEAPSFSPNFDERNGIR